MLNLITRCSRKTVNKNKYDVFGNAIKEKEQIHNRFRYAGEQHDPVTKQYYLRARFYNPSIGRFTQEDVYRGDGVNLYAYVGNNPINYIDPSGYSCESKGNSYVKSAFKQLFLGNYTEDVNLLGTGLQIGSGFLGVDIFRDIN